MEPWGKTMSVLNRIQPVLNAVASLAMIVAAIVLVWTVFDSTGPVTTKAIDNVPPYTGPISTEGMQTIGDDRARWILVEHADFECPACAQFAKEIFPLVREKYIDTGKVLFGFRNMPLPMHKHARRAAEVAVCAGEQRQFWPMYERLFSSPAVLDQLESVGSALSGLKVDLSEFQKCLAAAAATTVDRDVDEARRLGLRSTPTFMIGKRADGGQFQAVATFSGVGTPNTFVEALDRVTK